ncbi:MAG: hypothetical protein R3F60_22260 [bacterium]
MVGTLTVISKIITASQEMGIFNGYCGAESVPVSAIAPATLFSADRAAAQPARQGAPAASSAPWAATP